MEEELVALAVTDDMPPTQASKESRIDHGSVVPDDVMEIHDGEHIEHDHGETEVHSEADLPTEDTVVAAELTRELGPFDVEAKTHGMEAITSQTSSASIQQGESSIGAALTEADGF